MEKTRQATFGDRTFTIRKFEALKASYIAFVIFGLMKGENKSEGLNEDDINAAVPLLDEKTFRKIQIDCLKVISEKKLVGGVEVETPVMTADGQFSDESDAYNLGLVITLTINALVFNVQDFFAGGLDELKKSLGVLQDILS